MRIEDYALIADLPTRGAGRPRRLDRLDRAHARRDLRGIMDALTDYLQGEYVEDRGAIDRALSGLPVDRFCEWEPLAVPDALAADVTRDGAVATALAGAVPARAGVP